MVGPESLGTARLHPPLLLGTKTALWQKRGFPLPWGRGRPGTPALRGKPRSGAASSSPPPEFRFQCFPEGDGASAVPRTLGAKELGCARAPPLEPPSRPGRRGLRWSWLQRPAGGSGPPARSRARSARGGIPAGARSDGERARTPPRPGAGGIGPAGGQPGSWLPLGSPSSCCQAA